MILETFKYRLYPTKPQERLLDKTVETCRQWYNASLGERVTVWETENRTLSRFEQLAEVKGYREEHFLGGRVHSHILQVVATDVDKTFMAFFKRVQSGEEPGYPRFKGRNRFSSFGLKENGNGFRIDRRRLDISNIGRIRVRWHRQIEGTIKSVRISRHAGNWYACFSCEVEESPFSPTGKKVGIDVGIYHLLATSDGEFVDNPKWYVSEQKKLRVLQRRVSRRRLGGSNRCKALHVKQRQQEHVSNCRKDYLNKIADHFIKNYDKIAIEDLEIDNMVRNHHFSKSVLDAGWGYLKQKLTDKAVEAGRTVILVNPAGTSQACSSCGKAFEHLTLKDRWVTCNCGLSMDRDENAAINTIKRAGHVRCGKSTANRPRLPQEAPSL